MNAARETSSAPAFEPVGRARIMVNGYVYHQVENSQPDGYPISFKLMAPSDRSPYVRKHRVGNEWTVLDLGSALRVAMLLAENMEGQNPQVHPTAHERARLETRIVELAIMGEDGSASVFAWVRPDTTQPLMPPPGVTVAARCRGEGEQALLKITVLPG